MLGGELELNLRGSFYKSDANECWGANEPLLNGLR